MGADGLPDVRGQAEGTVRLGGAGSTESQLRAWALVNKLMQPILSSELFP